MPRPERPLDTTDEPVAEFAAGLRALRETAGNPAYRSLARRANFSAATLAAAASGRRLPTLPVTRAYVEACGGDAEEWTARWRELARTTPPPAGEPAAEERIPYVGLAPFQAGDAELFFGRRRLVDDLTRRLTERRLVVVFGPSGVGKSSIVRAGLIAHAEGRRPMLLVPGTTPLTELAVRLAGPARIPAGALLDDLAKDPARAGLVVRAAFEDELLLVVDQFEGVFAAGVDPAERAGFIAALVALGVGECGARVVLAVRADHYARFVEHPELLAASADGHVLVGGMSPAELRDAVVKPAERVGARVEGALVSAIVADVAGRPGALPLASHALLEAWRRRRGTTVTLAGYEAAGGVDGAVAATAESVYAGLDEEHRGVVRRLLLRMVDIDDRGGARRRPVPRPQIGSTAREARVVDRLVDARLLTADRDCVELAHESLIYAWPRLREWKEESRETLRAHRQLTESATVWQELGYDPGVLYRGARLALTRHWAAAPSWQPALSPLERRFVDESVRREKAEATGHHRQIRRRRLIAGALAAVLALGVTGGSETGGGWWCAEGPTGLLAVDTGMLTAAEDGYYGADTGLLRARTSPGVYGTWEQFQVCRRRADPSIVHLRGYAARKRFVSARPRRPGDTTLRLTAASLGPWEWLKVVPVDGDGTVLLRSVGHDRYLTVQFPGPRQYAARLAATAPAEAGAGRFRFTPLP